MVTLGHAVLAQIAENYLTLPTKQKIDLLFKEQLDFPAITSIQYNNPPPEVLAAQLNSMALNANWADAIKSSYMWKSSDQYYNYADIHFLDTRLSFTESTITPQEMNQRVVDTIGSPKEINMVNAMQSLIKTSYHHLRNQKITKQTQQDFQKDIRILCHLFGDAADGCHLLDWLWKDKNGEINTRGGNSIPIAAGKNLAMINVPLLNQDWKAHSYTEVGQLHFFTDQVFGYLMPALQEPYNASFYLIGQILWFGAPGVTDGLVDRFAKEIDIQAKKLIKTYQHKIKQEASTLTEWVQPIAWLGYEMFNPNNKELQHVTNETDNGTTLLLIFRELEVWKAKYKDRVLFNLHLFGVRLAGVLNALLDPDNADPVYISLVQNIAAKSDVPDFETYINQDAAASCALKRS